MIPLTSENYPDIFISELPDLETGDNKTAKVLYFKYSNYDAVAYIDEPKIVAMIVLTSRYENGFKESYRKFEELVKSYSFLTSNVKFDK